MSAQLWSHCLVKRGNGRSDNRVRGVASDERDKQDLRQMSVQFARSGVPLRFPQTQDCSRDSSSLMRYQDAIALSPQLQLHCGYQMSTNHPFFSDRLESELSVSFKV
jgi:hypothetical protein